jgi:hypothetical protein
MSDVPSSVALPPPSPLVRQSAALLSSNHDDDCEWQSTGFPTPTLSDIFYDHSECGIHHPAGDGCNYSTDSSPYNSGDEVVIATLVRMNNNNEDEVKEETIESSSDEEEEEMSLEAQEEQITNFFTQYDSMDEDAEPRTISQIVGAIFPREEALDVLATGSLAPVLAGQLTFMFDMFEMRFIILVLTVTVMGGFHFTGMRLKPCRFGDTWLVGDAFMLTRDSVSEIFDRHRYAYCDRSFSVRGVWREGGRYGYLPPAMVQWFHCYAHRIYSHHRPSAYWPNVLYYLSGTTQYDEYTHSQLESAVRRNWLDCGGSVAIPTALGIRFD